jgi:aspartate-semialdehyde dehydrogenase
MDKREDGGYATPFVEATNHDDTFVSRIREDISPFILIKLQTQL